MIKNQRRYLGLLANPPFLSSLHAKLHLIIYREVQINQTM
jgi:hypothetical protein